MITPEQAEMIRERNALQGHELNEKKEAEMKRRREMEDPDEALRILQQFSSPGWLRCCRTKEAYMNRNHKMIDLISRLDDAGVVVNRIDWSCGYAQINDMSLDTLTRLAAEFGPGIKTMTDGKGWSVGWFTDPETGLDIKTFTNRR